MISFSSLLLADSNGTKVWDVICSNFYCTDVKVSSSNDLYVTGYYHSHNNGINQGLDGNSHTGGYDIILVKFNSDGEKQ